MAKLFITATICWIGFFLLFIFRDSIFLYEYEPRHNISSLGDLGWKEFSETESLEIAVDLLKKNKNVVLKHNFANEHSVLAIYEILKSNNLINSSALKHLIPNKISDIRTKILLLEKVCELRLYGPERLRQEFNYALLKEKEYRKDQISFLLKNNDIEKMNPFEWFINNFYFFDGDFGITEEELINNFGYFHFEFDSLIDEVQSGEYKRIDSSMWDHIIKRLRSNVSWTAFMMKRITYFSLKEYSKLENPRNKNDAQCLKK